MTTDTDAAAFFEQLRPYLTGLCYRMLGSVADAEDIVQESFLRWRRVGRPELRQPRAWFTKTCSRLCLDRLKSAQRERERYVGEWLPEPLLTSPSDEQRLELDETLSMALLRTIETLPPPARAVFLLHDVFGYPFEQVAEMLELTAANCRQLASRARRRLREGRRGPAADRPTVERLCGAFFAAIRSGDELRLRSLLADEVVLRADGGGKASAARRPIEGAAAVARFLVRVLRPPPGAASLGGARSLAVLDFNGAPGVVVYEGARPISAFHFDVRRERVAGIYVMRNPDKLAVFAPQPRHAALLN